jgi:hypothetical protein
MADHTTRVVDAFARGARFGRLTAASMKHTSAANATFRPLGIVGGATIIVGIYVAANDEAATLSIA